MTSSAPHSSPEPPPPHTSRAVRLRPGERIAPYITRSGRFRRIDPLRTRPLPSLSRILGVLTWLVLLGESFRRALFAARAEQTREGAAPTAR